MTLQVDMWLSSRVESIQARAGAPFTEGREWKLQINRPRVGRGGGGSGGSDYDRIDMMFE